MKTSDHTGLSRRTLLAAAALAPLASARAQATPTTLFTNIGILLGDRIRENAALAVIGGRIAAIGDTEALLAAYPQAERYDGRGKLLMPGLVNCHAHLSATLARGFNEDFGFPNSAKLALNPNSLLSPEERTLMVSIGALEAIRTGTTTLVENVTGIAPAASALAASGLRMVFAEAVRDSENVAGPMAPEGLAASVQPIFSQARREEGLARIMALHSRWHGHDGGRVSVLPAANLAETSSPDLLQALRSFADKHGLSYTIHLSQSIAEVEFMKRWHGLTPPAFLAAHGFLGPRLFAAHCRYVDAADIALIGNSGMTVSHQAGMAANRGVIPPIHKLRAAGARIAYGTDNNTNDLFSVIRTALLTERIDRANSFPEEFPGVRPQPEDMWEDATLGGANALGMADQTGSIAVGKKADLIVVDTQAAHLVPSGRFLSALVHNGQPSDIVSSMVDGRFLMRDHKVLTMDEPALIAEANKVGSRIWNQIRAAGPVTIPGRPAA
ncbi:chlorohydrolase [Polymorphobacter multimanifer]|uniref:amidohydrolase family protein n=1 Tax=Polymorphobacter multimanifer TaxID=1070431 RepID=UPI00166BB369|nr:amidohydrolase family protein [Polymorphobacter multimanifer]GGI80522.1 chlorohydrolase [Polymorphobacter multimanifer]